MSPFVRTLITVTFGFVVSSSAFGADDVVEGASTVVVDKTERQKDRQQNRVEQRVDSETDKAVDKVVDKLLNKLFD